MLSGLVCKAPEVRKTPGGVSLARFTLEHLSRQSEAGMAREARCKIIVVAAGEALAREAAGLEVGSSIRVTGFITRMDNRQGSAMIALHAQEIQTGVEENRD